MIYKFPDDFLIGTSTSAFQIETPVDHHLKGIIAKDGSKLISTIEHEKNRFRDAKFISKLGNAYRFSLDWGRLQKYPYADFEVKVVNEYKEFLKYLKQKNVKLLLVLHHFSNPNWFEHMGSWRKKSSVKIYLDYVKKVCEHFGDYVEFYDTFNEPGVYAMHSYLTGFFPPYIKNNFFYMNQVVKNMSNASNQAYKILKKNNKNCKVGFAKSVMNPLPVNFVGIISSKFYNHFFVNMILNRFKNLDYIGLNYYGEMPVGLIPFSRPDNKKKFDSMNLEHDDMWVTDPIHIKNIIKKIYKKYNKPIIITENGYCGKKDNLRIKFIKNHLKSINEIMQNNVKVLGYFYWSTFDNFELYLGTSFRFGLVNIDYKTMKRKIKSSGVFYSNFSKNKYFED